MDNNIRLIMGVHSNNPTEVYTWYLPKKLVSNEFAEVGNYAIVQNCNGYALVKIVGFIDTTMDNEKLCTGVFGNKKVINVLSGQIIDEWRQVYKDNKNDDSDCPSKQPWDSED